MLPRIIPMILIEDGAGILTKIFRSRLYLGDPLNLATLYSRLGVDELVILDKTKDSQRTALFTGLLRRICGQVEIPISYGGGIGSLSDVSQAFDNGIDKLVFRVGGQAERFMEWSSQVYGSQSVVSCINYGYPSSPFSAPIFRSAEVPALTKRAIDSGSGEILLQNVRRNGTRRGLDYLRFGTLANDTQVPVILSGGARSVEDITAAFRAGFSGVAAATIFSTDSVRDAPLVSYFADQEKEAQDWL